MVEYTEEIEDFEEEITESEEEIQGREMFEHHRFEADKGQMPLRVDKFLLVRLPMPPGQKFRMRQSPDVFVSTINR